jgi:uncharacterized protein
MTDLTFAGQTEIAAPRARVAAALADARVLSRMIPGCTELTPTGPGTWTARIEKAAGPVMLRLTAALVLETLAEGQRYVLQARGRSLVAGAVALHMALALEEAPGGTRLIHDGRLSAEGLAGRLLRGQEVLLAGRSDALFSRLREHLETTPG